MDNDKYSDLFIDNPTKPMKQNQPDEYERNPEKNKHNLTLLLVYLGVMMFIIVLSQLFFGMFYPDLQTKTQNIQVTENFTFDVGEYDDTQLGYPVNIQGSVTNDNPDEIPTISADITLIDEGGSTITSFTLNEYDVPSNQTVSFDETIYTSKAPADMEASLYVDADPNFYVIINTIQFAITAGLFLIIDKKAFKMDWKRFKKTRGMAGQIVIGMVMVYAVGIIAQYILYFLGVSGTSQNEMQIANMFQEDPLNLILLFLTLCVFTPVVEEIVYRKVLYGFLSDKFGTIAAIAGSGLIFGLMHVITQGDFIQSIPYVFMGSVFGYIYYRARQNIFVVIGVHFLNNLISYLGYLILIISI